jgi:hypothetical protein
MLELESYCTKLSSKKAARYEKNCDIYYRRETKATSPAPDLPAGRAHKNSNGLAFIRHYQYSDLFPVSELEAIVSNFIVYVGQSLKMMDGGLRSPQLVVNIGRFKFSATYSEENRPFFSFFHHHDQSNLINLIRFNSGVCSVG